MNFKEAEVWKKALFQVISLISIEILIGIGEPSKTNYFCEYVNKSVSDVILYHEELGTSSQIQLGYFKEKSLILLWRCWY